MSPLEKEIYSRGLKKTWIAEKAGISRAALSNIFKGSTPTLPTALKLAKILNKTVEELWGYLLEEEPPENNGDKRL